MARVRLVKRHELGVGFVGVEELAEAVVESIFPGCHLLEGLVRPAVAGPPSRPGVVKSTAGPGVPAIAAPVIFLASRNKASRVFHPRLFLLLFLDEPGLAFASTFPQLMKKIAKFSKEKLLAG